MRRIGLISLLTGVLCAGTGSIADAAVYVVDRLGDDGAGAGTSGDLRYCLTQATSGDDTIIFSVTGTITLSHALPVLATDVSVEGPGSDQLSVVRESTNPGRFRILTVGAGNHIRLSGMTVSGGWAAGSRDNKGGGIFNEGLLTLEDVVVFGNRTDFGNGGGIWSSGDLSVLDSTIGGNQNFPAGNGGGIYNAGGNLFISHSTLFANSARIGNDGGGLFNTGTAVIELSLFQNNGATGGGGLENLGTLTIRSSTFDQNGSVDWYGGAILNSGTLTVIDSTISNNRGGIGGGGIANFGSFLVQNTTLTGNAASQFGTGGAVLNFRSGARVVNSTIAGNSGRGGGIFGGVTLQNTIVAGNGDDVTGAFVSQGHNLIGRVGSATGFIKTDLLNVDPLLGPLKDNGGPTKTMALLGCSPAIDAGDNTGAPEFDQRGRDFPRVVNNVVDIGAYEVQLNEPPTPCRIP